MDDASLAALIAPWSLAGALRRLLPREHEALSLARDRAASASASHARSPGWLEGGRAALEAREWSRDSVHAAAEAEASAAADRIAALRALIAGNSIVVFGRRGSLDAPLTAVAQDQARDFHSVDVASSTMVLADGQTRIYSTHLLPPLAAPGFEGRMAGSVIDIVDRHVWLDPEIVALLGEAPARNLADAVATLGDGRARLSLGFKRHVIINKLNDWGVLAGLGIESEFQSQVAAVAADRLLRLFDGIRGGSLRLMAETGGETILLTPDFWQKAPLALCVVAGAFYPAGESDKATFVDVSVVADTFAFGPPHLDDPGGESTAKKPGHPVSRHLDAAVDRALMEAADGLPGRGGAFRKPSRFPPTDRTARG